MAFYSSPSPKSPHPELHVALAHAIPHVNAKDKEFALSLYDYHTKHGVWSDKQAHYAKKFVDQVGKELAGSPVVIGVDLAKDGDKSAGNPVMNPNYPHMLSGLVNMLVHASNSKLMHPQVIVMLPNGDKIKVKFKNTQLMTVTNRDGSIYFGKIMNGMWVPKNSLLPTTSENIYLGMVEFSHNPAGAASGFGKLTGKCCFCAKTLTDSPSVAVGYGPVCAEKYNLPYGKGVGSKVSGNSVSWQGVPEPEHVHTVHSTKIKSMVDHALYLKNLHDQLENGQVALLPNVDGGAPKYVIKIGGELKPCDKHGYILPKAQPGPIGWKGFPGPAMQFPGKHGGTVTTGHAGVVIPPTGASPGAAATTHSFLKQAPAGVLTDNLGPIIVTEAKSKQDHMLKAYHRLSAMKDPVF